MLQQKSTLSPSISSLREELLAYDSPTALTTRFYKQALAISTTNIWLFGPPGVGKSKLTNSLFKSLHNAFDRDTAAVSGSKNAHVTKDLKYIPLSSHGLSGGRPGNINIVDAWGNDETNYSDVLFDSILKGKVSSGHAMGDKKIGGQDNKNRMVHSIVFVITAASCSEKEDCTSLARFYQTAIENHLFPIVVVTKVDGVNSDLKEHPEQMDTDKDVVEAISSLCTNTGIEQEYVFPVRNLSVDIPKERNDFIVYRCLEILNAAIVAADRFFEYKCVHAEGEPIKVETNTKLVRLNAQYLE